jgi:hypothetical protein
MLGIIIYELTVAPSFSPMVGFVATEELQEQNAKI